MKKAITVFLSVALLFSCKSKKHDTIIVLKSNDIEIIKSNKAYALGKRLLEACNTSKFKPFSSKEATESVIKNATIEKVTEVCKKVNFRNGKFISLSLIDISLNKTTNDYTFRYAIEYEKKLYKRELFVTINEENKVSAIATKEVKEKPL
ncbi:MAG: hypothetical protein QM535_13175 [Limnohabitans sp.]|nr:hypothetical protein [Limnohabitans sp.]